MELRASTEKLFDFSGTNFALLHAHCFTDIFSALSFLPHMFSLRLNNCRIDENSAAHIDTLALGIMTATNMESFEFMRSISGRCSAEFSEAVLLRIAESLIRNHNVKTIKIDGYRVTPPTVCEILKNHPTAIYVFVDGLPKSSQYGFFKPASNEVVSSEPNVETPTVKYAGKK